VVLWEHAELEPPEIGETVGERGEEVGSLRWCARVEILDYEWSEFDQQFWLLVDDKQGQRGWLAVEYIELSP
jgi:hypothetical protein